MENKIMSAAQLNSNSHEVWKRNFMINICPNVN